MNYLRCTGWTSVTTVRAFPIETNQKYLPYGTILEEKNE